MGLPIVFVLTGGEVSDFKGYLPVVNAHGLTPKVLLGNKGYDADLICQDIESRGGLAMIPTKWSRLIQTARRCRNLHPAQHGQALLQQAEKRPKTRDPIRQNRR